MLRSVVDPKDNGDLWIKTLAVKTREVSFSIENQPVGTAFNRFADKKKGLHTTVLVSPGVTQFGPTLIRILRGKRNCNTTSRRAARDVEDMRRDGAHLFS